MSEQATRPLEAYLEQGISARDVRRLLEQHDCLTFPQLPSGMFPAANFDNLADDVTGMAESWLRDTACISQILLEDGQVEIAGRAARGVMDSFLKMRPFMERIIQAGHAPPSDKERPPVRFSGPNSDPRPDWANAQNDAIGYGLRFIGAAARHGVLELSEKDSEAVASAVDYLETISYWQDADSGHWEEDKACKASSIGAVVAGLKSIHSIMDDKGRINALIAKGEQARDEILPNESLGPALREHDAALLFLVEPMRVVQGNMAQQLVADVETYLMGEHGIRRYNGDSYWGPDYRAHLGEGERAADFSDPADMALRNAWLTPGGEAQWTLFDPILTAYYARQFQATGQQACKDKAGIYMARSLRTIITHIKPTTGETVWRIPEAYFLEKGNWVPNDHIGLLWTQANLIYALHVYAQIFAGEAIKIRP